MKGIASMYARPRPRLGALSTRAPCSSAISSVRSRELETLTISIGGGGTDLPSYYTRRGGFLVSAAIDKYIYIGINRTFTDDYFLKYSALERVKQVEEIDHSIIRSALTVHDIGPSLEIVSLADIPAGTGLGSSGSFTVGLLRALYAYKREHITPGDLAEEAARVEIEIL